MGSIDDSQGLKWAGRSPPNGGRSPAGNKQGGHSREREGKSLRLSGQDELCFGWSQPQKELEEETFLGEGAAVATRAWLV